jgi:RND superfamily putative drug exporter
VQRLRERVPVLLDEAGLPDARVRLAGDTALADETVETISEDLLRIGIAAFLVNFLLLVVFLRAVLAPLYLVLASTLALAASIGLTTLVFQGLLGHDDLTYHVPFAVAVLLLSLGSDYNVFVVGRIWQQAERMPLREAIATTAPRASRAITVAGLALAASFAALALLDLRQFREFAFAMVVGILLDAFLVRSLLIPALISLFGERSWWPWRRRVDPALDTA